VIFRNEPPVPDAWSQRRPVPGYLAVWSPGYLAAWSPGFVAA
jgi:hypothetical protein